MILNIKINDFGSYKNFYNSKIKFGKFNLLLGWNYSGKTTLSRIFASFDNKKLPLNYENIDFELWDDSLPQIKITQNDIEKIKTKVFNSDYVKNNLSYEQQNATNIIFLADGAVDITKNIVDLEKQINILNRNVQVEETKRNNIEKNIGQRYTNLAREISEQLLLVRSYNATNIKKLIEEIKEKELEGYLINDEEIIQVIKTCKNEEDKKITIEIPKLQLVNIEEINNILQEIISISEPIERLKNDKLKEKWVNEGLSLHENENCCIFCGRPLTEEIRNELNNHFSEIYSAFGNKILEIQNKCIMLNLSDLPKIKDFYPNFQEEYKNLIEKLNVKEYNERVKEIKAVLDEKLKNRILSFPKIQNYNFDNVQKVLSDISILVDRNNTFSTNFLTEKEKMCNKVKEHFVAKLLLDNDYKKEQNDLKETVRKIDILKKFICSKQNKLIKYKKIISDSSKGAERINEVLKQLFLGNTKLKIEVIILDTGEEVTKLYRDNKPATNLSEGEKTAIAFAHFIASLDDNNNINNKNNTILFIDDPISSLDNNHIFSVFAMIDKLKGDEYNQIFISTHNYDFYKLFVDRQEYTKHCFYIKKGMVTSTIELQPECYRKFRTDYNFLYYSLRKFYEEPNENDLISIGNNLRKFLEIYTSHKLPGKEELSTRVKKIVKYYKIDSVTMNTVTKISNTTSHAQLEQLFIDVLTMREAILRTFKFIMETDRHHYLCLSKTYHGINK